MGFLKRVFGGGAGTARLQAAADNRDITAEPVYETALEAGDDLVELEIVGESFHQDAIGMIAGPKGPDGKRTLVGVTLRCEPNNPYDENAIRVEVLGQLVGHVAREQAAMVAPAIAAICGGVIEARGLIVGGWKIDERDASGRYATASEGSFGVRAWITARDAARLNISPVDLDPRLRPQSFYPTVPEPAAGEVRLSPTPADLSSERYGSVVTVVNEEHYQPTILAAMPPEWDNRTWPLLVDLAVVDCNPHAKQAAQCVAVRIGAEPVGYFTPAMSLRHCKTIETALGSGGRVTAKAHAARGTKGGVTFWRIKVEMRHTDCRLNA